MIKLLFQKIRNKESNNFDNFIFLIIVISAIVIGIETDHVLYKKYFIIFHYIDIVILAIFIFEIFIKIYVHGNKPWKYFTDWWNIFDFMIVLLCLLPYLFPSNNEDTHALMAFRMLRLFRVIRVFRVFRVITHFQPLQSLVDSLLRSIPQMLYVIFFLFIIFYIYAVTGYFLFGTFDHQHFGNLPKSFITLFECVSGNWSIIMNNIQTSTEKIYIDGKMILKPFEYPSLIPIYFISFYLLAGLIILNLFIGIIVSEMSNVKRAARKEKIEDSIENNLSTEKNSTIIRIQRNAEQLLKSIEKLKIINEKEERENDL
jgi:voltage-gated sodium channel